jgi:tetratricopeptide (TPR) repeat protein
MGQRIHAPFLAALLAATLAGPVVAQTNRWVDPPSNSRRLQGGEQTRDLNFLFEALKVAPDDSSARSVEERIWALWLSSGGDTTDLLMSRVKTAVEAKDLDLAIKLLDAIIDFRPEYVEGWDRRATIYYLKKEYGRAVADISQVLAREPRHFGALFGLGLIMQEFGDEKRALDVFRRALAIDPRLQRVPDLVKTLTEKIEGRDI